MHAEANIAFTSWMEARPAHHVTEIDRAAYVGQKSVEGCNSCCLIGKASVHWAPCKLQSAAAELRCSHICHGCKCCLISHIASSIANKLGLVISKGNLESSFVKGNPCDCVVAFASVGCLVASGSGVVGAVDLVEDGVG